ncbi:hypothetical protein Q5752_003156 [Cryptotrichosporon argae]
MSRPTSFAPPPPPPVVSRPPSFAPPPPPTGIARPALAPPVVTNGNGAHEIDGNDDDDDEDVPEPPAVVGSWTFPMKGMFPPPRPWTGGRKTYANGRTSGGGVGFSG